LIRQQISDNIKAAFKSNFPRTVHWDGKTLLDIIGRDNFDCLPILISGGGVHKLLGVPKLNSGMIYGKCHIRYVNRQGCKITYIINSTYKLIKE